MKRLIKRAAKLVLRPFKPLLRSVVRRADAHLHALVTNLLRQHVTDVLTRHVTETVRGEVLPAHWRVEGAVHAAHQTIAGTHQAVAGTHQAVIAAHQAVTDVHQAVEAAHHGVTITHQSVQSTHQVLVTTHQAAELIFYDSNLSFHSLVREVARLQGQLELLRQEVRQGFPHEMRLAVLNDLDEAESQTDDAGQLQAG